MRFRHMIDAVAKDTGLKQVAVERVLVAFREHLVRAVLEGNEKVEFPALGVFEKRALKPKRIRHMVTREPMYTPGVVAVKFRGSKFVKKPLNG